MSKRFLKALCFFLTIANVAWAETTLVDVPAGGTNNSYISFRAPLQTTPLIKLPIGAIKPSGWLLRMLELQRDGLNGNLGSVSAWLDKKDNQWLSDEGDHGWEEVPYWLRGYSSLAYILNDKAMKDEAFVWFDAVLRNTKADGFLGPRNYDNGRPEVWAQMIMLWALQTYYEHSGDQRVLDAMTNYFKWELTVPDDIFLKGYWENKRVSDNIWSVIWLYNRTGDKELLPLIDKLHRNGCNWMLGNDLPNWHGVNFAQGFREPATYYIYNGDRDVLTEAYRNIEIMHQRYGQVPGGMYGADENARSGYFDPRQGAETCALVEQMVSDEIMMGITGDVMWADHCEDVAFNTLPAAFTEDMRALRYITSPNMAISDEQLHGPSIDNNLRGMLSMSPFSSRCCQHNHGMGWPYYAEHLTMATADNGAALMLYASNETNICVGDAKNVTLIEDTKYPFEESVTVTMRMQENVTFPLYMRIPSWCTNASVTVNGKKQELGDRAGKYVRIEREWKDNDRVQLMLPMIITTRTWQQNKNSVSVNYGPLTLSLKIQEVIEPHDSRDHAFVQDDSHWQQGVDANLWPCYVIKPGSDWNYGLVVNGDGMPEDIEVVRKEWPEDNYPFSLKNNPIEFTAVGRKIPSWGYDATGMTDVLPSIYAPRSKEMQKITLVPMGAARLRISAFPREKK